MNKPFQLNRFSSVNSQLKGFTLIELMIVISIIAVLLALAIPVYTNYSIRSKINVGFSVSKALKVAVGDACKVDPNLQTLEDTLLVNRSLEISKKNSFVEDIHITGPCIEPKITITTIDTGQTPAPILLITGKPTQDSHNFLWTCSSFNTPNLLLPSACRN